MEERELENIPVPWGHIAVKAWGDKENPKVLVFHGILDNAGAFDRIIPMLPNCFYYIVIDLPGHGKSSHFPPYFPIHTYQYLFAYKYIMNYFGQKKYIVIGHSYGAQIALWYEQIYPGSIEKLVMLDTLYMYPLPASALQARMQDLIDDTINLHEKMQNREPPKYDYEEIMEKVMNQRRYGEICREAAVPLIKRGTKPAGNSEYQFTLDQRLKHFMNYPMDFSYVKEFLKRSPVLCPVLVIHSKESNYFRVFFKPIIQFMKRRKNYHFAMVEGTHDVFNHKPEVVAPHISKFLLKPSGKL